MVHEFDLPVVANVVDQPRGIGGAGIRLCDIPGWIRRGRTIEHTDHAFNDVVDVGKVPPVLTAVENGDLLTDQDVLGEFEQRHVRSAPRAIDGEEAQAGGVQVVQMTVSMRHQLI